jgi:hypothetical protein
MNFIILDSNLHLPCYNDIFGKKIFFWFSNICSSSNLLVQISSLVLNINIYVHKIRTQTGLEKSPGNSKKFMGMEKTGFHREKQPFFHNACLKCMMSYFQIYLYMYICCSILAVKIKR